MEIPKVVILLCCAYYGLASHDAHTIPVENYETELHNLGEHVEIPETPVRVIKITKTVAVKVPVPYPVKVIQKVPYPVHISKPYPVPVPHIVRVPQADAHHTPRIPEHEALGSDGGSLRNHGQQENYEVQEKHSQDAPSNGNSYAPENLSYNGGYSGHPQNFASYGDDHPAEGLPSNSYEAPSHNYYGNAGDDSETFETKSYDEAIKNYLQQMNSVGNADHGLQNYNYH